MLSKVKIILTLPEFTALPDAVILALVTPQFSSILFKIVKINGGKILIYLNFLEKLEENQGKLCLYFCFDK